MHPRVRMVVVLVLSLAPAAAAQDALSVSGYLLDLPGFAAVRSGGASSPLWLDILRARVRPTVDLWQDASIGAEYEAAATAVSTPLELFSMPNLESRQVVPLRWIIAHGDHVTVTHVIDRLAFRQNGSFGSLIVGRQRIAWGSGRVWNPTDLFNPLNPSNVGKIEKDGVDAVSLKLALANLTDVQAVYNAANRFRSHNAAVRVRTNIEPYDIAGVAGIFDSRIVLGGDFAGNLGGAGTRGECIWSSPEHGGSSFVKYILGIDAQLTPLLYALAEYHFNGQGADTPSEYDTRALEDGTIINVGRHYASVAAMYQVHPLVMTTVSATANLDDASTILNCTGAWSASDDLSVTIGFLIATGRTGDEYRMYPDLLYGRVEWYF